MNAQHVERWIQRDPDPQTSAELSKLLENQDERELALRFAGRLEFGTAGLRGVLGGGPMRMNRLVVRETSAGLGQYLLDTVPNAAERGVVIGYDGRLMSREFAEDAANVFATLGLRVYLSEVLCPTPVTAFAVKHLNAAAGVMVTASHNPPEYNGYKVYWGNGAQIIPPHDAGIAAAIDHAALQDIPFGNPGDRIHPFPKDLVQTYHEGIRALSIHDNTGREHLTIAYTPLHGVGAPDTLPALKKSGFNHVFCVAEQEQPDGHFPTVRFPNPEEKGAMDLVLALATAHQADLAIANDPDADRLAVAARNTNGDYTMLTGDQIGILLGWDRLQHARANAQHVAVATTIVSSQLLGLMAQAQGATYFETLTGFKWIANASLDHPDVPFVFGYEEALGYTVGELVRDKDGVGAAVMFCEMAAALKTQGKTVLDQLDEIYTQFGVFLTGQTSLTYGPDDTVLRGLTDRLRTQRPSHIGDQKVVSFADLEAGLRIDQNGEQQLNLPKSDVLIFKLEDGSRVIVRPSGTEPKIKIYYEVRQPVEGTLDQAKSQASQRLAALKAAQL